MATLREMASDARSMWEDHPVILILTIVALIAVSLQVGVVAFGVSLLLSSLSVGLSIGVGIVGAALVLFGVPALAYVVTARKAS